MDIFPISEASYTERARKVIQLARQETQRFRHAEVTTIHLLGGFIKEGSGPAVHALKILDIDLRRMRIQMESMLRPGVLAVHQPPCSPDAVYVLQEARRIRGEIDICTEKQGPAKIGDEDMFLGLLCVTDTPAMKLLEAMHADPQVLWDTMMELLGHGWPVSKRTLRSAITGLPLT